MSTPPLPPLVFLSDFIGSDHSIEILRGPDEERAAAFAQLRTALSAYLEMPGDTEAWLQLRTARREACEVISRMPRQLGQTPEIHDLYELVREMSKSGVHDRTIEAEDLRQAQAFADRDWRGILAAMLLVPAWQWPDAPLLLEVPEWMRADFVRWLFVAPSYFSSTGQAEAYAAFVLKRLEELVRWMNRGPGGKEEMKVLGAYASHSSLLPASFGPDTLRRQAELRGRLLLRAMGCRDDHYRPPVLPRNGHRMRIGIIHRHFAAQSDTYALLPMFERLDPDRFEVILFSYVSDFSRMEDYCRQQAAELRVLPADIKDQLGMLRNAALDVAFFSTNVTAECNVVTRLALHRVAPLQVVNHSSTATSGLPEIDLFLTGEKAVAEANAGHFTERLGILPGASHAFNFEADGEEAQAACTRADFGLPEEAFVFVSTANYRAITPEMRLAWARLLAAVPGSYLLLHPFQPGQPTGHTIHHFHAAFESALKSEGVDPARLAVSCVTFSARTDVRSLVGLGDVYLDTNPMSAVDALFDPLELGLPVVAWEGSLLRSRTGASLLRTLAMDELVAHTAAEYQRIAVKLATDSGCRDACRMRLQVQMQTVPAFLDSRLASQGFGDVLELAFDELATQGRAAFRANPLPVRIASRV